MVTANKVDFGEGPMVATDLARDVLNPQRIELVQSLNAFNKAFIEPKLVMVEEMKSRLQSEAGSSFDIPRWLHNHLVDVLRDQEYMGSYILGFPDGVGSVRAHSVVSLESFAVDEVLKLSEFEILVRVSVKAEVEFGVNIDWDDYVHHREVKDYIGSTESFVWLSTDHIDTLSLGYNLVLDSTGTVLIESELGTIDGPYASTDWSSW